MRRRKYRQTACVQLCRDCSVSDIRRPPIRTGSHLRVKLSLRIVVSDRRDHLPAPGSNARSGRG